MPTNGIQLYYNGLGVLFGAGVAMIFFGAYR